MKRATVRKTIKWIKILLVLILILTSYILGYATGLHNLPATNSGAYDIELYDDGKVVITTDQRHISSNGQDGRLIIYGNTIP